MKTLIPLLTALLCNCAAMADIARPVLQSSTTKALVDDLATGAKKMTISATGTLEWVNGGTMSGASYFRTAAGLGIGVNVQAYDADLTTIAALAHAAGVLTDNGSGVYSYTPTSTGGNGTDDSGKIVKFDVFGQIAGGFVGTLESGPSYNFVAIGEGLSLGSETNSGTFGVPAGGGTMLVWTLPSVTGTLVSTGDTGSVTNTMLAGSIALTKLLQSSATSGQVIAWNGTAWAPATISSGLTIGSTVISGGTDGYILYYNAGILGNLATTGSGSVVRATSPTLSDALISGYTYFGNSGNWARRDPSTGNTEFNTPSGQFTFSSWGTPFLTVATTGIAPPGIIAGLGYSIGVPGGYPTVPSYEHTLAGRSFRPGVNTTAFANIALLPGDIYDGAGITVTDAATLYVQGEPYQHPSGAAIAGNKWALWIAHGPSRFDGPVTLGSGGTKHTKIKSGVATLVAGTVTVSDSDVLETGTAATSSRILVTRMTDGGTLGTGYSITRTNATSFTITSSSASETSTLSWMMLNP